MSENDKLKVLSFEKDPDEGLQPFDIYDPASYDVDEAEAAPVAERKLKVRLRRPHQTIFVRAAAADYFRFTTHLLRFEDREDVYNVVPSLWGELEEDLTAVEVFLFVDRDGAFYLWNIPRGSEMDWHKSARYAVEMARQHWIRIVPDMGEGVYRSIRSRGDLADPDWPDLQPRDYLEAGFKGRTITSLEHEAVDRLRGSK